MFSRLSRLHINLQFLVVALGALLLWMDGFMNPKPALEAPSLMPLYGTLLGWVQQLPILSVFIAFLFTFGTAILWHYILVEEGLLARNNFIPILITMLVMAYSPDLMRMNAALPANFLLILSVRMMMRFRHRDEAYQDIFSAGLLLGCSVLFNPWNVFLLPLIWIALQLFRVVSFREWLISLLGFFTPLLWFAFFLFWNDRLYESVAVFRDFFNNYVIFRGFEWPGTMTLITLGAMGMLFIPAFFRFISRMSEKLIALRKCTGMMAWFFLLSVPVFFTQQSLWLINSSVILLPLSLMLSSYLTSVKRKLLPEILLALLVAAVITGKFVG